MRFHLQDVKKSVQRRGGELSVTLHFLRPGELHHELEQLIAYHERLLGQSQRQFSLDEARTYIGDYRLADCLIATLSHWYQWRQRNWEQALQALGLDSSQDALAAPTQLRLALYSYVNEQHQGFLDAAQRAQALHTFAAHHALSASDLEYLLTLDSEEEQQLVREADLPPSPLEVATLYNQWAFEAALMQASSVHFVIDCNAFSRVAASEDAVTTISSGVGTVIKRLCFLARKLGVYYDLAYDHGQPPSGGETPNLLLLTLYGPQEVTGAPQQYGLRLARLCRMLLNYGRPKLEAGRDGAKKARGTTLASALVKAEATIHFLQRAYTFVMGSELLRLVVAPAREEQRAETNSSAPAIFDSSIEESFSHAFEALARSHGVDGWQLEREPEPLLLKHSIFIPDFALTRAKRRIYVEILGFWTPAYRERKVQKLQELRGRDDLVLAIPQEAREAFVSIAADFPIVYYDGQLSVTEMLQVLRGRYDDFAERMARVDVEGVRQRVRREGMLAERLCYAALHCYRRSELQQATARIVANDIAFMSGIGLYHVPWMDALKRAFLLWMSSSAVLPMTEALRALRGQCAELVGSDDATLEALLGTWPELRTRRASMFDAVVELVGTGEENAQNIVEAVSIPEKGAKRVVRERGVAKKKRAGGEEEQRTTQGDLWGLEP